jgi:hypothetical protein
MSEETAEKEGTGSHGQRHQGLVAVKDAAAISSRLQRRMEPE